MNNETQYNENELITISEAADLIKVSEISIKRYISKNIIPSVKIGGARRIIKNEIWEQFLEQNKDNQTSELTNGVHFYWSQKNPEIAQQIYFENCKDKDVIMDPFLGGGSSLYGTRNTNFKFIGIDINELPYRLAKFNIQKIDSKFIETLANQIKELQKEFSNYYIYKTNDNKELQFVKAIFDDKESPQIKIIHLQDTENNKFTSDDYPEIITQYLEKYTFYKEHLKNIENPLLNKNSRIAIKENMYLSDIFSPINFCFLSEFKEKIKENNNIKFILASVLQLCKLTDTKSQSQFPFWIPKKDIVDRNIFITLLNKVKSLEKFVNQPEIIDCKNFDDLKFQFANACLLFNKPIQNITEKEIPDNSVDFILTDPPYFDQVAYSEYLKIWEYFLGYNANLKDEIIVSQRDIEPSDENLYLENLKKAFEIIRNKLKNDSKIFIYFKDSRPDKMFAFLKILDEVGFNFLGQEYLNTGKYTYKQNTTTKTTLTGECILKFSKTAKINGDENSEIQGQTEKSPEKLIQFYVKTYLLTHKTSTLGEILSSGLVKQLYDNKMLDLLKKSQNIVDIIEQICDYNETERTYKLKNETYENQLLLGDCIDILQKIPSNSVDCCITDPPYNISGYDHKKQIGWLKSNNYWKTTKAFTKIDENWDKFTDDDYDKFTIDWLTEIKRILKPNGNIAIFGSYHNIYKIGFILEKLDLKIINSLVWYKRNAFPNITQRMFCESTEYIIWATNNSKKDAKNWTFNYNLLKDMNGGKQMRNFFDVPITKASEKEFGKHPSQKPLEILDTLVLGLTNENEIVIDPFLGSGTTAVSSVQYGRKYIGIDQNFEYLQLAEKRIEKADKKSIKINKTKEITLFS